MQRSRSAIVVAATPGLAMKLCSWLRLSGWHVLTVTTYAAAKSRLEHGFALLVTELELGDYNGLQLALRAQGANVPALVVGRHDTVLERDAEQLGCTFLRKEELNQHGFLIAVDVKIEAFRHAVPHFLRNLEFVRRPSPQLRLASVPRRMLLH